LNGGVVDAACTKCECPLLYGGSNCAYTSLCLSTKLLSPPYATIKASSASYANAFKNDLAKALSMDPSFVTSVTFTGASDGTTMVSFCIYGTFASSAADLAESLSVMMNTPGSELANGEVTGKTDDYTPIDVTGTSSQKSQTWAQKNMVPLISGIVSGAVLTLGAGFGLQWYRRRKAKHEKL